MSSTRRGENAQPRGQARRWASPCSNSPRATRTRAVELDETCRGSCSDEGALRNCARRGPRRHVRGDEIPSRTRPPRPPVNLCGEVLVPKLATVTPGAQGVANAPRSVVKLQHEYRAVLEPCVSRAGLLYLGASFERSCLWLYLVRPARRALGVSATMAGTLPMARPTK